MCCHEDTLCDVSEQKYFYSVRLLASSQIAQAGGLLLVGFQNVNR